MSISTTSLPWNSCQNFNVQLYFSFFMSFSDLNRNWYFQSVTITLILALINVIVLCTNLINISIRISRYKYIEKINFITYLE